ncbi:MerR family transcriptional regulator [Pseudomonas guariconensis]|uniref:MerR family transcriptional regulator n=1 Tax=Pseudomonas TaxID=286 RepID=UPI001CE4ACA1|nr:MULTISPECIES: MerR family transcriptional regulator [Pseudomonas]MCO7638792.1 MerR family transcriptional regulator [Pseudomonas sp. S 311-6]MCO7513345.1 MerR family transcriptional regulator [Pseudomonas putida]MCO7564513.1 MerR family transcriptional regulator [Pseudomonas mosselii]MCO7597256.1 MerR family transcriptional regulator [Pseudomonas guariconensis]MCO7604095.1 MerR family transcriptional regulator [Pseudomonas guariconensis]
MQIGELALRAGVSTRALRHYESRQLIESSRLDNGYRDYATSMVQRVLWIRELLECGFSTRQIHGLLQYLEEEEDSEGFLACLQQHLEKLAALDALQVQLAERRSRLAEKIGRYLPLQKDLLRTPDLRLFERVHSQVTLEK